jgi:signal transduction histidine kinase
MPKSLSKKLALQLTALLIIVGVLLSVGALVSTRLYWNEVQQKLHRDLADHLLEESVPVRNGEVDLDALEHIFHMLMVVNPSIEVYLLSSEGRILSVSAPEGAVKRTQVDLTAVHRFLGNTERLPIFGDDPRSPDGQKVFSVAPIGPAASPEAYLYVMLGGQQLDSVAAMLRGSLQLRLALVASLGLIIFATATGIILFRQTTLRLSRLSTEVGEFRDNGFTRSPNFPKIVREGDELDRLTAVFKEMADRLIDQMADLNKTASLRRELLANVSHDLRTPLTSLRGYLDTLRLKEDVFSVEEKGQFLDQAIRQSERLSKLVGELGELARLESGTLEPHIESVPVAELVQDAVQHFALQAGEARVELSADLPKGSTIAQVDVGLVARALDNLIDNGLRHTPPGGKVNVELTAQRSALEVAVQDTGSGIPPEDLPRVFDRFFQRSEHAGSGGLGLAIAKRAAELHGGSLQAESSVGEGTVFKLTLPRQAVM